VKIAGATPVLMVDRVEPTREFFKRVGFAVAFEVPEGDRLGFAMLAKDGVQVMVETRGNANEPPPIQFLSRDSRRAFVFIEVDDLDAVDIALDGEIVTVERHRTFYQSEEITYEEPGGNLVTFAKFER
jgi:threonine dehydrogenase-like Zn-dependent dehydrogenase